MATSKQPPFPNPPLEWGIPQYPTPNVPDFHTKDGHIILVEKVSAEKGNYNPQPLDGSITYKKRDANKWPSTLYLVYQRPDETGQFVYNFYANDRTLASQDAWNFGLDYSLNNPAFPITSRTYIVPRNQYATVALGDTDPVFGGNQIIAAQKKVELPDDNPLRSRYVMVQRVYETIPGPTISGKRITERGDTETITQQTVLAGAAPDADSLLVTQTSVEPVDSVKSTKTKGSVDSYATLTTKASRPGLLGNTSTTDDIVAPSTLPDSLTTNILESSVEAISATKSKKRTTTASGPVSLSGGEYKSGLLGESTIKQSIVPNGELPDTLSLSIISSSVDPIDAAKSKKVTIESNGPTLLSAKRISERGDVQTITKSIVASDALPTSDSLTLVGSQVDEIDSAKSQKTDITVDSYSTLTSKANKGGLLGNVSISDSIVDPSTNPDALTTTILDSSVEAISATKSRKRTTTSSGPTLLSGNSAKAGLLGNTTITESIVNYNASPDSLTQTILSSEVTPIDNSKSKKVTIESTGPTLLSGKENKPGLLGLTTTTESIVSSGSNPDALTLGTLQSIVTPIDSAKSKKTTTTASGPTSLNGRSIGEFGYITSNQSIVSYGSGVPNPDQNTINLRNEPIDSAKAKLIEDSYDNPEVLDGYQYDADLNLIVHNTKEIISEGASPLSLENGLLAYTDTPINAWQSIRIQSKITSLPETRTEYKTGSYTSPNLLTGLNNSFFTFPDGTVNYNVIPVMRSRRSYQTVFKYETSFAYGQPSDPAVTLFDPVTIAVSYRGFFFSIQLDDCLTNSGLSITFSTGSNNETAEKYGVISETYNVPTSDVSASSYLGLINTFQIISYDVEYWKANIWKTSITSVLLK